MARPPRKSGRGVSFTPESAKRIHRAVLKVERGGSDIAPPSLPVDGSDADIVRGTFTAPWAKGSTVTVTDSILSAVTYTAKNYLTPVTGTGSKDCIISFTGGEWILVGFNLQQLDGFDGSKTQVLASVSGGLKWLDTTACT